LKFLGYGGAVRSERPVEHDREWPPVRKLHDDHIRRLHVAVRHPLPLAGPQRAEDLRCDVHRLCGVRIPFRVQLVAADALGKFIDEHRAVVVIRVEELADVGTGDFHQQRRVRQQRLRMKAVIDAFILPEQLQRDGRWVILSTARYTSAPRTTARRVRTS
jgi:hypothetical protein